MTPFNQDLSALQDRLTAERQQAIERLAASRTDPLPAELVRYVAELHTAALAVEAVIAAHTPSVGYGSNE